MIPRRVLKRIRRFFRRRPTFLMIAVAVAATTVYGVIGFHYIESGTWGESLYWTLTTMSTVGYGDLSPCTDAGRIHSMLLMIMGIGIFGLVVEGFISILLDVTEKRKTGLITVKNRKHILICGWSETVRECLLELGELGEECYVLSTDGAVGGELEKLGKGVTYVNGDPCRREDLVRAGADRASVIIVDLEEDPRSLDCLITLRDMTEARIVVEVERKENQDKFRRAGADELTIPFVLSGRLLAQSKEKRFLSRFVTEIVSTGVGMSLEEIPVEEGGRLDGKTLRELAGPEFLPDMQVLAVGRGDRLLVDTRSELVIQGGDRLICLTESTAPAS